MIKSIVSSIDWKYLKYVKDDYDLNLSVKVFNKDVMIGYKDSKQILS